MRRLYFLAYEKGKAVTVIEMLPALMKGVCTATRGYLIHYLEEKGVKLLNCARLKSIQAKTVTVVRNVSNTVPDPCVTWAPLLPENIKNPLARPIKVEEKEMIARSRPRGAGDRRQAGRQPVRGLPGKARRAGDSQHRRLVRRGASV